MRIKLIALSICALGGVIFITILYSFSYKINHQKNGFNRIIGKGHDHWKLISALDLKYNSYYIAGITDSHIYLGNSTSTSLLLSTDYKLKDTHTSRIIAPDTNKIAWKALKVFVDSPNVYMMEGILPSILHCDLHSLKSFRYNARINNFSTSLPLSNTTYVYRSFDTKNNQNILVKENLNTGVVKFPKILENQQDGVFSVDGMLAYEANAGRLVYLYFYRNQFICMDSDLTVLYKGNTIDTIKHAHITVSTLKDYNNKMTLSSPPLIVNRAICIDSDRIFINSNLVSDNEPKQLTSTNSSIDVYSLKDGKYEFSFYIPMYKNKKLTEFRIKNDLAIVINNEYLLVYKLNQF